MDIYQIILTHNQGWSIKEIACLRIVAAVAGPFLYKRGLFEWDDMIHNGLGCMLGSLFFYALTGVFRRLYRNT